MRKETFKTSQIKIIILVASLCVSLIPLAKLSAQGTVSYQFTRSEPNRLRYIGQIKLVDLDFGMSDPFRVGAGVSFDYFLPKVLSIHAAYDFSYFGITKNTDANTLNTDKNNIAPYSGFEAGIRLNLGDNTGTHKMKLVLSSTYTGYNTMRTTSIQMPYPCQKIFGLRGGIYQVTFPVTSNWVNSGTYQYTDMHELGFYVGLSSIVKINADFTLDGRLNYQQWFRENYLDFIYTPVQSLDPIVAGDGSKTPASKDFYKTSPFGFRLGHTIVKSQSGGITSCIEGGMRPGISGHGFYIAGRVGIAICNKTREKK